MTSLIYPRPDSRWGGGENPLLSIVVPVYNVEKYLRQCLDSLVRQTLKNIEIIVVNDCSPDNSEAIILEYAARDDRIVYIKHEENKCLGGARNTGIRAAKGKYIAFVDSDDYVDLHLYESAVSAFQKYDVDVVMLPYSTFNEVKILETKYRRWHGIVKMNANKFALDFFFVIAWNKVYRIVDLREHDILFPEHIYFEDNSFWVHYCLAIEPKAWYLRPTSGCYYYRIRSESITANRAKNCVILPQIFFLVYQHLQHFNKLDELLEPFYDWISGVTSYSWRIMADAEKQVYARAYRDFICKITLSAKQKASLPELALMCDLTSANAQILFIEVCNQRFNIKVNRWYQFGCLSRVDKVKKIFTALGNRILSMLHLRCN